MRIERLTLKNIGPFKHIDLRFLDLSKDNLLAPPTVVFTGTNGSGKSIIIDSIRALLNGIYIKSGRDIVRQGEDFEISMHVSYDYRTFHAFSTTGARGSDGGFYTTGTDLNNHINHALTYKPTWVLDYWNSNIQEDSFKIQSLSSIEPQKYLIGSLSGNHKNIDITKAICYFDYLKSSNDTNEERLGSYMMEKVVEIINACLVNYTFSHVARTSLTVFIERDGNRIELEKLSVGNIYLMQRFISLLTKMYSVHLLTNSRIDNICAIPGLLLIDEIENHFHPAWQKKILRMLLKLFPNLQIVLTTHSPFIISSLENSKLFVCDIDHTNGHSVVRDASDYYSNKPIEEILRTPLFDTDSFNAEISSLLSQRKIAIEQNNDTQAKELEEKLLKINPQYFAFLNIDNILESFNKGSKVDVQAITEFGFLSLQLSHARFKLFHSNASSFLSDTSR